MFVLVGCLFVCLLILILIYFSDAFIVDDNAIPMWPLWEHYFSRCPTGSYTVTIHQQTHFGHNDTEMQARIRKHVASVGGRFVCAIDWKRVSL